MSHDPSNSDNSVTWTDLDKLRELIRVALQEVYLPTKPTIADLCRRVDLPEAAAKAVSDFLVDQRLVKIGANGVVIGVTVDGEVAHNSKGILKVKIDDYIEKSRKLATEQEMKVSGRTKYEEIFALFQWLAERKYFVQFLLAFIGVVVSVLVFAFAVPGALSGVHGRYFDREFKQRLILPDKLPVDVSQFVTKQELLIKKNEELIRENMEIREELRGTQQKVETTTQDQEKFKRTATASAARSDQLQKEFEFLMSRYSALEKQVAGLISKLVETNQPSRATNWSIRVTLEWTSDNDLDIHMQAPNGQVGWFRNQTNNWGYLQTDIQKAGQESFFITRLEAGNYRCFVHNFRGGRPVNCKVAVYVNSSAGPERIEDKVFERSLDIGDKEVALLSFRASDSIDRRSIQVSDATENDLPWLAEWWRDQLKRANKR